MSHPTAGGEVAIADLLPGELADAGIRLRPQTEADGDFIRDLYVSHRWEELTVTGWPQEVRLAFLRDQARLQWLHYSRYFADAQFLIVEANGERIGRLYLRPGDSGNLHIVEIGFVAPWRGRGLGTKFLSAVQAVAKRAGKTCSIHVECNNPARRLYERLGFATVRLDGVYYLLSWSGEAPQQKQT